MSSTVTVTVDPHVHSEGSYDAHEPVELVLEHASDIGLDGVVITDHDEIDESLRAAELAPAYGLVGIPGVEISTRHGHLLAIGIEERPEPGLPFMETVRTVRELGGIAVVPHPFQRSRHGVRKRYIRDADEAVLRGEFGGAERLVDLVVVGDHHAVEFDVGGVFQDQFDRFVTVVGLVGVDVKVDGEGEWRRHENGDLSCSCFAESRINAPAVGGEQV